MWPDVRCHVWVVDNPILSQSDAVGSHYIIQWCRHHREGSIIHIPPRYCHNIAQKRAHAPTCHIIASINWYFIPISHFYCALELLIRFPNLTWMTLTHFPVSLLSHTVWFRKSLIQCLYLFGSIYFIYCSLFQCDSFRGSSPSIPKGLVASLTTFWK